jgi:subtilisin family serine protease
VVYPANYANVLGVSGVNENKSFAAQGTTPAWCNGWSNSGTHVDLSAPFAAYSTIPGNSYGEKCGTSMAAPHVAGAAALVRARNPTWSNQQVVNQLIATAEDRGPAGRDNQYGHGIVDAARAVGLAVPFVVTASVPDWITVKGTYQLIGNAGHPATGWRWDRSDDGGASWVVWATSQNSAFVAYLGEYTITWRLSATRTSDGATDTDVQSTYICTTPSCVPIPIAGAPAGE